MFKRTLICLTFAVVCSLAESGTPRNIPQSCLRTEDCLTPKKKFNPKGRSLRDFDFTDQSILMPFCQLVATQTRCIETTKSNCEYGAAIYNGTVMDRYICSDTTKKKIRNMKKSQCVHDKERAQEAWNSLKACHDAYNTKFTELQSNKVQNVTKSKDLESRLKSALDEWRTCCTNRAKKWCGPEYGQFITSLVSSDELRFHDIVITYYLRTRPGTG